MQSHSRNDVPDTAAFLNLLCSSTVDPFPAVKYCWTMSAGGATNGCEPGRKALKQMFAAGPGEDETRPVDHPVVHCSEENALGSSYVLAVGTFLLLCI